MRSISRYSRAFYSFVRSCSYLSSSCVKRASRGRRRCLLPAARFESRSFPLFLSLAPCKQSKDTGPFSLLLQIHSVSSTPHPFSFQLFPLFSRHSQLRSFFFFVASTNLRRILVSAFLAVFPLCFQPFSLRRKPSCSTTTWPSAFASASVFLHPFRARFSRNYFYPRLWCKFLLFSIPPRPLPYSLSQPLLCLCPISTIPASSFSFVRLPLSPTSPLDRPSPFSP